MNLKDKLERIFDIPFFVENGVKNYEPWYVITPENKDLSLFSLKLSFRNALRLSIEFLPQKYSASMLHGMGIVEDEKKALFCAYAALIYQKKASIKFVINHHQADVSDFREWPVDWKEVDLRISLMPITEDESKPIDYDELAAEWSAIALGLILSLLDIVPLDDTNESINGFEEGNQFITKATTYERNPINRVLCIKTYGYDCSVCGMNLAKTYGDIGKNFIHVHHVVPVSQIGAHKIIDPVRDLVPVCPNCHAMLHKRNPPFTIDELRNMFKSSVEQNSEIRRI